jgi:hypothetical protein
VNITNFQAAFAAALAAAPLLAGANLKVWNPQSPSDGSGIVVDRGNIGTKSGWEDALTRQGVCLIVGRPGSAQFSSGEAMAGAMMLFPVTIHENEERNRGQGGAGVDHLAILEQVIKTVISTPTNNRGQRMARAVSFKYGVQADGLLESIATFQLPIFFDP